MDDRTDAAAMFAAAQAAHRQNRLAQAERLYAAVLTQAPGHADAREWLGFLLLQTGRTEQALTHLRAAAAARPGDADFQDNLAMACLRANRPADAIEAFRRSLAIRPENLSALTGLGNALGLTGRYGEADDCFARAVAIDPALKAVCRDVSRLSAEEERSRTILENCRHILARYPAHASVHYSAACELEKLGRFAEACKAAEKAIACNPTLPVYYHVLVQSGAPAQKQAARRMLEQLVAQEQKIPEDGRMALHFELAKLYEGDGQYAEAFAHLQTANALKRRTVAYDEAAEINRIRNIPAVYPAARLDRSPAPAPFAPAGPQPLFVVGMPRSGTTLVEQILASHPSVYGAGELSAMADLERALPQGPDAPPAALHDLGARYRQKIAALAPHAVWVVDKNPLNFLRAGLIRLALPQARIVHVRRNPLDTCFSCYEQMFSGPLDFAYDLGELGRYYRAYAGVMEHWRAVLPTDAFMEVRYEDLVADLEGQARRLIAFSGLEWDARCLNFHKTERVVATASFAQVRQPIYTRAVGRAEVYAPWLEPLSKALAGEELPPEPGDDRR